MERVKTYILEGSDCKDEFKLERCKGCSYGCRGLHKDVHCPICPVDSFKPNSLKRTLQHLRSHFHGPRGHVRIQGYIVTSCLRACRGGNAGMAKKGHYHCPVCDKTVSTKQDYVRHVNRCVASRSASASACSQSASSISPAPAASALVSTQLTPQLDDSLPMAPIVSTEDPNIAETSESQEVILWQLSPVVNQSVTLETDITSSASPQNPEPVVLPNSTSSQLKGSSFSAPQPNSTLFQPKGSPDTLLQAIQPQSSHPSNRKMCSYCGKECAKSYLARHIKTKYLDKTKEAYSKEYDVCLIDHDKPKEAAPTIQYHHYVEHNKPKEASPTQCHFNAIIIDPNHGVYCIFRNYIDGPQHPIHVVRKTTGDTHRVECSVDACKDLLQTMAKRGYTGHMCDHLTSVQYCSTQGVHFQMDMKSLEEMINSGYINAEKKRQIEMVEGIAREQSVPLIVEVPWQPYTCTTQRYRWFSVFSGTDIPHDWCRFKRTFVCSNSAKKTLSCHCTAKACVHQSIVRWLMFQTNQQAWDVLNSSDYSINEDPNIDQEDMEMQCQ